MLTNLPNSVVPYVLLQRSEHLLLRASAWPVRLAAKVSGLPALKIMVAFEAFFRRKQIIKGYVAGMVQEYDDLSVHLPEKASAILDIGCGLGAVNVPIHNHYHNDPNLRFYLLDKTAVAPSISYGYRESRNEFYNSLDLARTILSRNGIPDRNIFTLDADENHTIDVPEQVDLVFSLISWGFHYPMSTYLERVHQILKPGGRLIVDVRRGTDGIGEITEVFGNSSVISEGPKKRRILALR